jgi:CysZ protein
MTPVASDSPVPALRGGVADLFAGLALPFRALRLIFSTGPLFRLSLLASIVTAFTLLAVGPAAWSLASHLTGTGVWAAIAQGALFLFFFAIGALSLPPLLLAPIQDPLSAATETACGGDTAPSVGFVKGTLTSLSNTLKRIALMLLGYGVLLPLNLIAGVGSGFYAVLSSAWVAWCLTGEYLSGPMGRHLRSYGEVQKAMRARPLAALGFGGALYVLLWLPILNFFLVPIAVVGATLLFRALKEIEGARRPD